MWVAEMILCNVPLWRENTTIPHSMCITGHLPVLAQYKGRGEKFAVIVPWGATHSDLIL